jgi:hypothetical protein
MKNRCLFSLLYLFCLFCSCKKEWTCEISSQYTNKDSLVHIKVFDDSGVLVDTALLNIKGDYLGTNEINYCFDFQLPSLGIDIKNKKLCIDKNLILIKSFYIEYGFLFQRKQVLVDTLVESSVVVRKSYSMKHTFESQFWKSYIDTIEQSQSHYKILKIHFRNELMGSMGSFDLLITERGEIIKIIIPKVDKKIMYG